MSRKDNLIKSKSIYTIRKKHQTLSDATIYENDHVTIIRDDGIFNTDMPLFSDSNFKFRIRSGGNGKKKHNRYGWITNESSDDNVCLAAKSTDCCTGAADISSPAYAYTYFLNENQSNNNDHTACGEYFKKSAPGHPDGTWSLDLTPGGGLAATGVYEE